MRRILVYVMTIVVVAAVYLAYYGTEGVTARNVVIAIPLILLFASLIWLRWDVAPKIAKERRDRNQGTG